jgi:hypothetical protein
MRAAPPGSLNQHGDGPVTTEYRGMLGGILRRMYSLESGRLDAVFPGAVPRGLDLL